MKSITRRKMLGALASGAGLAPAAVLAGSLQGAPERVRLGVIGTGGRAHGLMRHLVDSGRSEFVALCDANEPRLASAKAVAGGKAETYRDFRALLDRKDIEGVVIATPDHWHCPMVVAAVQAGKDVYVEKPVSHNVWEGRRAVEAARKYGRIVQAGMQIRSSEGIAEAFEWVRAGNLGAIRVARGLCYKPRQSIGKVSGPTAVPQGVDYDLWTGPAPMRPLMRARLHYDWHWVFDTGNGDLGNQGIHQMDLCRWVLGERRLAPRVMSAGGRFGYEDDGETPNTQFVFHDYEKAPLVFEVRGLPRDALARSDGWNAKMDRYRGVGVGIVVECEGGHLAVPSYDKAVAVDAAGKTVREFEGASDHFANFIAAVRSRRAGDLAAPIEEGHVSSALCHAGNVSHLLGRGARPEVMREAIRGSAVASETFERFAAHLEANGIDLASTRATLGPWLEIDPAAERFAGDERANRLLAREYRAPFVVPARV